MPIRNQFAAFTGDSIFAPASEPFLDDFEPDPPDVLRYQIHDADNDWIARWRDSLDTLALEPVTLWLPRHPFWAQNAFLYNQRWNTVVLTQQSILQSVLSNRRGDAPLGRGTD